jgi:uncharacterized protein HemX
MPIERVRAPGGDPGSSPNNQHNAKASPCPADKQAMSYAEPTTVQTPFDGSTAKRDQKTMTILVIALVVGVLALGVAIFALSRTHTVRPAGAATVAALGREVHTLKAELASTKAELTAATTTAASATAKQQATLSKFTTCIPELTGQINGLSVETGYREIGGERYLTSAYLKTGTQISSYCQSTLEPSSH